MLNLAEHEISTAQNYNTEQINISPALYTPMMRLFFHSFTLFLSGYVYIYYAQ